MDDKRHDWQRYDIEPFDKRQLGGAEEIFEKRNFGDENLHSQTKDESDEKEPVFRLENMNKTLFGVGHANHVEELRNAEDAEGRALR